MKQIVVKLTEEQQALIKLSATAIDAKASKPIIEAMGLMAIGKIANDLNV